MKIYTIAQQKGGTGKTTTAAAIGQGFINRGKRVLFVDLDPQGNLSYILDADTTTATAFDVLTGKTTTRKAAQPLKTAKGSAIIPATPYLSGADATITGRGREYRLQAAIRQIYNLYDVCIIDTPPALGILTVNALTAADSVIIPCQADILSIQATAQITDTINGIKATSNPDIKIAGILLMRYHIRQNITKQVTEVIEQIAGNIGTKLFNTRIRECIAIRESQAIKQDIYSFSPRSNGAKDYNALIDEITTGDYSK